MERKTEKILAEYEIAFPDPEDIALIQGSVDLINHFYKLGLMLAVTTEQCLYLASKGTLVVAKNLEGQVVGTAAYTQFYDEDIWEFGGWAVAECVQGKGVGKKLLEGLFIGRPHQKTIAFGNKNSGPILEALGAETIDDHSTLPQRAFTLCADCLRKPKVGCCDTIYDLSPVIIKMTR